MMVKQLTPFLLSVLHKLLPIFSCLGMSLVTAPIYAQESGDVSSPSASQEEEAGGAQPPAKIQVKVTSPEQNAVMKRALERIDARRMRSSQKGISGDASSADKKQGGEVSAGMTAGSAHEASHHGSARQGLGQRLKQRLKSQETLLATHKRFSRFPLTLPLPLDELKTTSCAIFLSNLESRLKRVKALYDQEIDKPDSAFAYWATMYSRAQLYSDIEGLVTVKKSVDSLVTKFDQHNRLRMLRARVAMTLHQLPATQVDLAWLKSRADLPSQMKRDIEDLSREVDLQLGVRVAEHIKAMQKEYSQPSYRNFILVAQAREFQGQTSLAQRYYGQAERRFKDVAPIPLAWLNVQRGLLAMHSGDYEAAQRFFKAGYDRCPQYPMAVEHLAEIEGRLGNLERSTELYEVVIQQTQHPEFMAALAEVYLQRGMKEKAEELTQKASRRFAQLEAIAPEAMSAHAADFYRGLGKSPTHALELLRRNYTLRPNAHAQQALADILIELDHLVDAEKLIHSLMDNPEEFAEKYWTAAKLALAQKRIDQAKKYEEKAKKLNSRIADLEGELIPLKGSK